MDEIEKLRSKTYTEQINVPVEPDMKRAYSRLKSEHGINTAAEIRKALATLLTRLESAVTQSQAS